MLAAWFGPIVFGKLYAFLKAFMVELRRKELEVLMPILAGIVAEVDADPTILTSQDRFQAVFTRALAVIAAQQLVVGKAMLWFAIGLAVQSMVDAQAKSGRGGDQTKWD